jgi:hypothetical protein
MYDRDHVFSQLTQEQINESRLSLLEVINNEPDDRETADIANVASTSKAVPPALTAVEESCVSVTTKPTSPDDTSTQQVRSGSAFQCCSCKAIAASVVIIEGHCPQFKSFEPRF